MAIDTYAEICGRVILRCPNLSPSLSQDFVRNAFRRLAEVRRWSWRTKFGQFIAPTPYTTGTVTVTLNSTTVTGAGGATFTSAMVGRQFRIGTSTPLYTIASFNSSTSIELDSVWGSDTASGQTYSIYQAFFTVPSDFHQFITLWDPAYNWQLHLNIQQTELNIWDAQRANIGNSYCVSFRDYTSSYVGVVNQPVQVDGSGNDPTSGGTYSGPNNAIFTVEITTGGAPGTAVYRWKKDSGSYTSGVTTSGAGTAQSLQDGVTITFPLAVSYTLGDIWVISCLAQSNSGLPRYELWPHQQAAHLYPFLYEMEVQDLSETGVVLPRYIRGDVLLEMAMEDVASWPGPSEDKPNPYFNPIVARKHREAGDRMVHEAEIEDDNVWMQDLQWQYSALSWPYAAPYLDSRWVQSHAI